MTATESFDSGRLSLDPAAAESALLEALRELLRELRPRQAVPRVTLDSSLEGDLGLDSLARAELLLRVERDFDVHLPEQLLAGAETPRDLVRAMLAAGPRKAPLRAVESEPTVTGEGRIALPDDATTVTEVLTWHVEQNPERRYVLLYSDDHEDSRALSYRELYQGAMAVAGGLHAYDLAPGQSVAIMLPTSLDFFYAFFGILLAGGVPVPIYPPFRPSQLEDHLKRQVGILRNAQAAIMVTVPEALTLARILKAQVPTLKGVATVAGLAAAPPLSTAYLARPEDTAFMQYTSGSTGNPKGVVLSHANLVANIRAIGDGASATSDDVFVSWLPLYHDMGLIGACLGTLYHAVHLVLMSPLTFLSRPQNWLWDIHRHRGTISAGPNFAYELCARRIPDGELEGLDLSSWRLALNGAEPVNPSTLRRFTERFARYGFQPESLMPVYGMAEASVGLAFPPDRRPPIIDRIRRDVFTRQGRAVPAEADEHDVLEFVACGQPLPKHEIRIVDAAGREVGEREEGRLQFRGPSTTTGYFRNPAATKALFDGDWLESGDRAYIAAGDIFITGRVKDIIIRGGRNIYPHQVEEAVGEVAGVRTGCVAVFGTGDADSGTERLIVLAETRETDPEVLERMRNEVNAVTAQVLAAPPDEIVFAPPHTVLKTSSGKIRRSACRELYESGSTGGGRAVWLQLVRLSLAGVKPQLLAWWRTALDLAYAGWWWSVLGVVALVAWPSVVCLPSAPARWSIMRAAARAFFRLTGTPLKACDTERAAPDRPAIFVANHASYLDGLALIAALPGEFTFVAKRELEGQLVPRLFLSRLGTAFVERFDAGQSLDDAERLLDAARSGRRIFFFPEGTLSRMPGLLPFRQGAFVAAAQVGRPVLPVTIRGTRSILRDGQWFPRRGAVQVLVGEAIEPEGDDWNAAITLRDKARAAILATCGEPDLGHETAPTFQAAGRPEVPPDTG